MKQYKERITNKYKNLQGKPIRNIQGVKHKYNMYRYVYKINLTQKFDYKRKEVDKELLHSAFIDKPYIGLEGREYTMLINNVVYYLNLSFNVPSTQQYKEGMLYKSLNEESYGSLSKELFYTLQHISKYVHKIQVTL